MQPASEIRDIVRPPRALCDALARIGAATASSELNLLGLRDPQLSDEAMAEYVSWRDAQKG